LDGTYDCIVTPFNAILQKGIQATYNKGCDINSSDKSGFAAAVAAAKAADVAVMFIGIDNTIEYEGMDRVTIDLPGVQLALVQAVMQTGTPVVVVLINGGALAIEWIQKNVPAILEAFYAGEQASLAIADVLFGDYNPGGKLPYTVFPANYVNQISMFDMNMNDSPGRTYRYYTGQPLWPFGFGLSYTTFNLTWINQDRQVVDTNSKARLSFRVDVKNIGPITGDEVALAFVTNTDPDFPLKQLFGFKRVTLTPGQQVELFFSTTLDTFAAVTEQGQRIRRPGTFKVVISNGVQELNTEVTLKGKTVPVAKGSYLMDTDVFVRPSL
jgi:hypothetical protein